MKKVLLFIAPGMLLLASCSNQTTAESTEATKDSTASFDLSAVKSSIEETNKTFSDAIVKGDSVAVADLYASDANMLPPDMPKIENHDGILHLAGSLARMGIKKFSLESTNVYGNPDLVVEEGKWSVGDGSYPRALLPPAQARSSRNQERGPSGAVWRYSWSGKTKPKYSTARMFRTITQPARTGSLPGYTD